MRAVVTVLGKDKTGIIYHISEVLYKANANIIDLDQTVMTNEIFTMIMLIDIKNISCDYSTLKERLTEVGNAIGLTIRIQQEDIFNAMHTI